MRDMVREIGRQMERFEGLSVYDVGNLSRWREVLSDNLMLFNIDLTMIIQTNNHIQNKTCIY